MKEFYWQEVLDYLDQNLDKEFDFGRISSGDNTGCLICEFLKDQNVEFIHVSGTGDGFYIKDFKFKKIHDFPFKHIHDAVGWLDEHGRAKWPKYGRDIKENIEKFLKK